MLQELLLRQRVEFVLIVCPASVCLQWRDEMERRSVSASRSTTARSSRAAARSAASASTPGPRITASSSRTRRSAGPSTATRSLQPRRPRAEEPADPRRGAYGRAATACKYAIDSRSPIIRDVAPALREPPVPVGDASQRPLEQLLGASRDPRSPAVHPRRAVTGPKDSTRSWSGASRRTSGSWGARGFPSGRSSRST